jgi:hypothetical protein
MGMIIGAFVFSFVLWIIWPTRSKGALGEYRVRRTLGRHLDKQVYWVFNDLTLPTDDGTTQIDHVIVSRFGVVVVETKNLKGWIFGSTDQPQWTQVVFRWKSRFQNPIRQNYKHVRALQNLLQIDARKLQGIVAFVGSAVPRTDNLPGVVWSAEALANVIQSHNVAILKDNQVEAIVARLSDDGLRSNSKTRKAHVRHIQAKEALKSDPANCPRCGATLVERPNRQTGARFLACTQYPKCKGSRSL